jgi:hypothetical protein
MTNIDQMQVIGGKRKNGHKMDCTCHICENMKAKASRHGYEEDLEKEKERKMGGPQKKNGHKKDCGCPICKNMNKSKGGDKNDDTDDLSKEIIIEAENKIPEDRKGGSKKKNTRRASNGRVSNGRASNGRASNGHKLDCSCPICKNMKKTRKNKMSKKSKRKY